MYGNGLTLVASKRFEGSSRVTNGLEPGATQPDSPLGGPVIAVTGSGRWP
jgi:hypothetical protein